MKKIKNRQLLVVGIILATGLYFFANLQKVIIPGSIFNELQQDFNGTATEISALNSVFMYTYAGCQLIVGLLIDRYCGTRVMIAGGALFCIGSIACSFATNLPLMYICRFLVGAGASSIYLSLATETYRVFTKKFTVIFGFIMLFGYAGGITGTTPFIAGVKLFDWRNMLFMTGGATLIIYICFLLLQRNIELPATKPQIKFDPLRFIKLLKNWYYFRIFIFSGIAFGTYFIIQTVLGKKFLEDYLKYSPTQAGIVMSIMMFIASINGLFTATLNQWLGNRRSFFMLFMGFGGVISTGIILLDLTLNYHSSLLIISSFFLISFSTNMGPIYITLLRDTFDEKLFGTALSFSNFLAYMITAFFGTLTGYAMELFSPCNVGGILIYGRASYTSVFILMTLLGFIRAWFSLGLKKGEQNGAGGI